MPRLPLDSARFRLSVVLLASSLNTAVLLGVVLALGTHMQSHGDDPLPALSRSLPWILVFTLVVSLGMVWTAVSLRSQLSVPLERLAQAARRISTGALEAPIPQWAGSDELGALSAAMESMRARLVDSIAGLDQQNQLLHTMLDALGDGVLFLDSEGRVQEYNPRAAQILDGMPAGGALLAEGVPLRAAFPELPPRLFRAAMQDEVALPVSVFPTAEAARHLVLRVFPVRDAAQGRAFVAVVRDVTEDREVDRLKTDFLSVITHELKTPLTAMDGFVRLLLAERLGPLTPKQRTALETTRDQSEALRRMVQDLLDTTRLESGTLPIAAERVPVGGVLTELWEALRPGVEERGLRFVLDLGDAAGAAVQVDPFRLKQILGNFLSNAMKFTPSGGQVTLGAGLAHGEVELWVADTGRGIPAASLPRMFRKFYQVEQGDTRRSGGTGLGLYIGRQLTVAMGGALRAESEEGKGSRFTVSFPAL